LKEFKQRYGTLKFTKREKYNVVEELSSEIAFLGEQNLGECNLSVFIENQVLENIIEPGIVEVYDQDQDSDDSDEEDWHFVKKGQIILNTTHNKFRKIVTNKKGVLKKYIFRNKDDIKQLDNFMEKDLLNPLLHRNFSSSFCGYEFLQDEEERQNSNSVSYQEENNDDSELMQNLTIIENSQNFTIINFPSFLDSRKPKVFSRKSIQLASWNNENPSQDNIVKIITGSQQIVKKYWKLYFSLLKILIRKKKIVLCNFVLIGSKEELLKEKLLSN
jgi:hypothetical protein